MRESRPYGSVRGACHETHVPTATASPVHHAARRCGGGGMVIVGLDYGHAGQMTLDEITGGSPYGATTIAGGDGSRLPTANELQGARYQGRKIAETANKLHG